MLINSNHNVYIRVQECITININRGGDPRRDDTIVLHRADAVSRLARRRR